MRKLIDNLQSWVSSAWGRRGVRRGLLFFGLGVLALSGLYALVRVVLFLLGTLMQFWYKYTQTTWLLWFLTFLSFFIICGFGYLAWVRRSEFLVREREDEAKEDVYGGFEEDTWS